MRLPRLALLAAACAAALWAAPAAFAKNGAWLVTYGTKSLGRGGADAAVADDATSMARNPALIMGLYGSRADLSLAYYVSRSHFRNELNDTHKTGALDFPFPLIGLSWDPFGPPGEAPAGAGAADGEAPPLAPLGSNVRIGLNFFLLAGGGGTSELKTTVFPDGQDEMLATYGLALAPTIGFNVTDRFAIGIQPQLILYNLGMEGLIGSTDGFSNGIVRRFWNPAPPGTPPTPVDPPEPFLVGGEPVAWTDLFELTSNEDADASNRFVVEDVYGVGYGLSLGMLWRPFDALSIGLAYQFEGQVPRGYGDAKIDAQASLDSIAPELEAILGAVLETYLPDRTEKGLVGDYDFKIKNFRTPAVLSLGVALRPTPGWLIALDFRYVFWKHAFDVFKVKLTSGDNRDINEINGTDDIDHQSILKWEDSMVVAIGTAVDVTDWLGLREAVDPAFGLVLRMGYQFGENPVTEAYATPNSAITQHGLGLGASVYAGSWDFDIAYMHSFTAKMHVEDHQSLDEWDDTSFKVDEHWIYLGVGYQF